MYTVSMSKLFRQKTVLKIGLDLRLKKEHDIKNIKHYQDTSLINMHKPKLSQVHMIHVFSVSVLSCDFKLVLHYRV